MGCARDVGVPVVVHTESTTPRLCKELVEMGRRVGLRAERIVKHFSPPLVLIDENHGLIPSILASRKNVRVAIEKSTRFLMESDYIDDPERPGAVLNPRTIPRLMLDMLRQGTITNEQVQRIHKENPEKVYNVVLE
jgi:TatD-related deoxyribonuclease